MNKTVKIIDFKTNNVIPSTGLDMRT